VTGVITTYMALAIGGLTLFLMALYLLAPLEDKRHPDEDDPRCWCEAFGIARDACYCVTFEDGDS
jgi:hypothetical protein